MEIIIHKVNILNSITVKPWKNEKLIIIINPLLFNKNIPILILNIIITF